MRTSMQVAMSKTSVMGSHIGTVCSSLRNSFSPPRFDHRDLLPCCRPYMPRKACCVCTAFSQSSSSLLMRCFSSSSSMGMPLSLSYFTTPSPIAASLPSFSMAPATLGYDTDLFSGSPGLAGLPRLEPLRLGIREEKPDLPPRTLTKSPFSAVSLMNLRRLVMSLIVAKLLARRSVTTCRNSLKFSCLSTKLPSGSSFVKMKSALSTRSGKCTFTDFSAAIAASLCRMLKNSFLEIMWSPSRSISFLMMVCITALT
mmetsp:Transcript_23711/g.70583  ORF Transcript_23711/g.70583 Transcript_23711/m.70583 type:complete len:256 (+) Transcript_23711:251-1018(+)